MATVWVTGSADGIGREAAATMVDAGHRVVLHARDPQRAAAALAAVPGADGALVGDLASIEETRVLADAAAQHGPFDAVIHNAGVRQPGAHPRPATAAGLELTFAVNVLAPYLLTALLPRPARLVYVSSTLQAHGSPDFDDLQWDRRAYDADQAYSDSKLLVVALAFAVARRWPMVRSNAVDPGWVRTRMGGSHAPMSLAEGAAPLVRLATSPEATARSGQYLSPRPGEAHPATRDISVQERLLLTCATISGVTLPT